MKLRDLSTMPARSDYHTGNLLIDLNTGWCGNRNAIYFDPNRTVSHLWEPDFDDVISALQQESAVGAILEVYPPRSTEPMVPLGWIKTTVGMDAVVLQSGNGIVRLIQTDYWHDAHEVGFDRITIDPNLLPYVESRKDTKGAGCIVFWSGDAPVAVVMPIAAYSPKEAKKLRAITPLGDKVMESAFAGLADALEAQDAELLQEVVDVLTVWEYMKENGYRVDMGGAVMDLTWWSIAGELPETPSEATRYFAAWVRQQEGYA